MTATHNIPIEGSTTVDGLPKSFVSSMRTLFDIMDDQHTGYIRFSEIERRWPEDGTQGLPEGVLSNLRKVTPPNGYLSFDRFCAGLKNCLLKKRERDESTVPSILKSIHLSSLSPTNSLEVIPPLKASSPQTSPRNKNRPLSAPLLDQDIYSQQPISSSNFYNEMNGARVLKDKTLHYPNDFISKPAQSSQHNHNVNSKVHGTKLDIRMGIGGIKGMSSKGLSNNHQSSSGPPKPPRSQDVNDVPFSQHTSIPSNNNRMTNSLERESRSDKRWNRESGSGCSSNEPCVRKDRGGSLERLLDAEGHKLTSDTNNYGPPLNRTGMRSALQTWFKERSKSDLQKVGKDAIIRKENKRFNETNKEKRFPPSYQVAIETAYRGNSETITHRCSNSAVLKSHVGRNSTVTVSQNSNQNRLRVPPPSHAASYINSNGNANYNETNKIYGKTMDTVAAVPAAYKPTQNSQGERPDIISAPVGNGPIAHGLYVAPQPPQMALHKKTSKKKEPRRHTLQNGVDQNAMKRLRQLEAERDMLYQGLDVVERAKIWYKMQLQSVSERIHYLPFGPIQAEPSMESQQEKLHFQLARIHEINAHLRALMDAQEKGIPAHMNLAVRGSFLNGKESDSDKENSFHQLKKQNKLLTNEVSSRSERITSLEHEKAALLRELFQARAAHRPPNADSTFM